MYHLSFFSIMTWVTAFTGTSHYMRRLQNDSIFQREKCHSSKSRYKNCHGRSSYQLSRECLLIPLCSSVNVHPHQGSSGRITYDLNNSSKTADLKDLVPNDGYQYRQMVVICVKINNNPTFR